MICPIRRIRPLFLLHSDLKLTHSYFTFFGRRGLRPSRKVIQGRDTVLCVRKLSSPAHWLLVTVPTGLKPLMRLL